MPNNTTKKNITYIFKKIEKLKAKSRELWEEKHSQMHKKLKDSF